MYYCYMIAFVDLQAKFVDGYREKVAALTTAMEEQQREAILRDTRNKNEIKSLQFEVCFYCISSSFRTLLFF